MDRLHQLHEHKSAATAVIKVAKTFRVVLVDEPQMRLPSPIEDIQFREVINH